MIIFLIKMIGVRGIAYRDGYLIACYNQTEIYIRRDKVVDVIIDVTGGL